MWYSYTFIWLHNTTVTMFRLFNCNIFNRIIRFWLSTMTDTCPWEISIYFPHVFEKTVMKISGTIPVVAASFCAASLGHIVCLWFNKSREIDGITRDTESFVWDDATEIFLYSSYIGHYLHTNTFWYPTDIRYLLFVDMLPVSLY